MSKHYEIRASEVVYYRCSCTDEMDAKMDALVEQGATPQEAFDCLMYGGEYINHAGETVEVEQDEYFWEEYWDTQDVDDSDYWEVHNIDVYGGEDK